MNELQQKEFEILQEVVNICEKENIKYFLVCGTALGAVKYKGFIPWDDDIDIGIFRNDYEKFLKVAPMLLPKHMFLQTFETEKNYPHFFAKIRNSNTTYIEKSVEHLSINHGIYIDIFPLDGYPKGTIRKKLFEIAKRIYNWQRSASFKGETTTKTMCVRLVGRLLGYHKRTNQVVRKLDKLIRRCDIDESDVICNHGNWQGKLEYAPKWHYGEGIWGEFEGLKVRLPGNADSYLTQKYGNWREDLPEEKKIGHHFFSVCDVNKSYLYYTEKSTVKTDDI